MSWFERSFGERYLRAYAHRDRGEAVRALDILFPGHSLAGRRVLDLGCGPGRYLRVLWEKGARPVGVDLSPVLLEEARRVFDALRARPVLVRADMRALPFGPRRFDLTLSMFTSFGYFEDVDAHRALAREMARVTSAVIVIDVLNPVVLARTLVPHSTRELDDVHIEEERWLEEEPLRVCKTMHVRRREDGRLLERYEERVMLFTREELTDFFAEAGFTPIDVWGGYDGESFAPATSERMIVRLRREGSGDDDV